MPVSSSTGISNVSVWSNGYRITSAHSALPVNVSILLASTTMN